MTGKLILISGRKGTGKTYVTEYLEGMLAGKVEIYPMATMLKRIVAAVTNCSVSQLDSHYFKLSKYFSASRAAIQPEPADVIA